MKYKIKLELVSKDNYHPNIELWYSSFGPMDTKWVFHDKTAHVFNSQTEAEHIRSSLEVTAQWYPPMKIKDYGYRVKLVEIPESSIAPQRG